MSLTSRDKDDFSGKRGNISRGVEFDNTLLGFAHCALLLPGGFEVVKFDVRKSCKLVEWMQKLVIWNFNGFRASLRVSDLYASHSLTTSRHLLLLTQHYVGRTKRDFVLVGLPISAGDIFSHADCANPAEYNVRECRMHPHGGGLPISSALEHRIGRH
jgi:hypothetical protein